MAKDRISSNRLSFSIASRTDARVDDPFSGDPVGGRAGSSPDSGNKPGARLEGEVSEDGSGGSSISFVLKAGEGDGPGTSPAFATPKPVIRMSAMMACDFIGRTVGFGSTLPDLSPDCKTSICCQHSLSDLEEHGLGPAGGLICRTWHDSRAKSCSS